MNKAEKIKRTPADIEAAMQEVEEKSRLFTEAHKDDNCLEISRHGNSHIEISEDLEEAAHSYVDTTIECFDSEGNPCCYSAFIAGAQWQKKHLLDNRIKYCNNITEDQYNLGSDFLDDFIDKHDRMPTFLDAIEYGMKLQKQQDQSTIELAEDHAMLAGMEKMKQEMMEDAVDGEIYFSMDTLQYRIITEPLGNFHHCDKVKLIIIKEE